MDRTGDHHDRPDGHLADQSDQGGQVEPVVGHAEAEGGGQGDDDHRVARRRHR